MKIYRSIYIVLGFIFLTLGAIGVIIPVLPTTPFLLLASFFFARGSDKFHRWFTHTKLYKNHMHEFITSKSMTLKTKWCILLPASTMMIIAIILCPVIEGQLFIVALMVYKYYYFFFRIKTIEVVSWR